MKRQILLDHEPNDLKVQSIDYSKLLQFKANIHLKSTKRLISSIQNGTISYVDNHLIINEHKEGDSVELQRLWVNISFWQLFLHDYGNSFSLRSNTKSQISLQVNMENADGFQSLTTLIYEACLIQDTQLSIEYEIVANISAGSQAAVSLLKKRKVAKPSDPCMFAVKTYFDVTNQFKLDQIFDEIKFLRLLKENENIAQLHQVYQSQGKLYLVMDYAKGGTLYDAVYGEQSLTEVEIQRIMAQLLKAVMFMHSKNIVHLDIKPSNILIADTDKLRVQITDFGISHQLNKFSDTKIYRGTPGYIAPEILLFQTPYLKSDIFSLGSLFYFMLARSPLFQGFDKEFILIQNKHRDPQQIISQSHVESKYSASCIDLLRKMLIRNHSQRFSAEECLRHPWFKTLKTKNAVLNRNMTVDNSKQKLENIFKRSLSAELQINDDIFSNTILFNNALYADQSIHEEQKQIQGKGKKELRKQQDMIYNQNKSQHVGPHNILNLLENEKFGRIPSKITEVNLITPNQSKSNLLDENNSTGQNKGSCSLLKLRTKFSDFMERKKVFPKISNVHDSRYMQGVQAIEEKKESSINLIKKDSKEQQGLEDIILEGEENIESEEYSSRQIEGYNIEQKLQVRKEINDCIQADKILNLRNIRVTGIQF